LRRASPPHVAIAAEWVRGCGRSFYRGRCCRTRSRRLAIRAGAEGGLPDPLAADSKRHIGQRFELRSNRQGQRAPVPTSSTNLPCSSCKSSLGRDRQWSRVDGSARCVALTPEAADRLAPAGREEEGPGSPPVHRPGRELRGGRLLGRLWQDGPGCRAEGLGLTARTGSSASDRAEGAHARYTRRSACLAWLWVGLILCGPSSLALDGPRVHGQLSGWLDVAEADGMRLASGLRYHPEFDVGQQHHNVYERTKFAAELPLILPYLATGRCFDSRRCRSFLHRHRLECPPPKSYFARMGGYILTAGGSRAA